jgi:hypothetical protein
MHLWTVRESTKAALDSVFCPLFNASMPAGIPKALTKKRAALGFRRQELIKALKDIDREIRVLEYSIKLVAPGWRPPDGPHRGFRPRRFKNGAITKACLEVVVRLKGDFATKELARLAAIACKVQFESKAVETGFLSTVSGIARRLEKIGALEECGRVPGNRGILWRTRFDAKGWLGPLKAVA